MIRLYFKQVWRLLKQNRFFSFVSISGTAVTIAFVMVAYMAYDLGSSDLPPEVNRSRSLYSDGEHCFRSADHSHSYSGGMVLGTVKAITGNLPSAELISIHTNNYPNNCQAVGGEGNRSRRRVRYVDLVWWEVFQYNFVAGKPFGQEDFDAERNVAVVTERTAQELFHTTDVVGREILLNYNPFIICGVVKNVSSQFSVAYCDIWANLSSVGSYDADYGSESVCGELRMIAVSKEGKMAGLKKELEKGVKSFNDALPGTTFEMNLKTHTEFTFYQLLDLNPALVYTLLVFIFLIVPAVNISGLVSSMVNERIAEIGIRKAYGASVCTIVRQFLIENLLFTLAGGILGMLLSFGVLYLFSGWIMGVSVAYSPALELQGWMLFRPSVFLTVFVVCLSFNLISALIPVWYASGKNIIETLKD